MRIKIIPQLSDNYAFMLIYDNQAILIDPAESSSVMEILKKETLDLSHILNTHHHEDHIGGNKKLKIETSCKIIGPDDARIQTLDQKVSGGSNFTIGPYKFEVIFTPGHTKDHVVYYLKKEKALFSGDLLFSAGCGRVFEGTYEQMLSSLEKIQDLPDDTSVYFGHEYTLKNLNFAKTLEKDNKEIENRYEEVKKSGCSCPTTIGLEKQINPFFRLKQLAKDKENKLATFERIRENRNNF